MLQARPHAIQQAAQCHHGLLVSWARNKSELLGKPAFDF
jgi:hypothetical protein